jgi:hypothetical protein
MAAFKQKVFSTALFPAAAVLLFEPSGNQLFFMIIFNFSSSFLTSEM